MRYIQEQLNPSTSALNQIISFAYRRNDFYRSKLSEAGVQSGKIHQVEHLKNVPFTTREELQQNPWLLLSVPKDALVQANISTGTTGNAPLYIVYDWEDLFTRGLMPMIAEAPTANLLRIKAGEIVFNALPYEVSVTGLAIHRALQDGIGACVVPVGKGGYYSDPEKTLKMMREICGDHLFTTPSYAVFLAEYAEKIGVKSVAKMGIKSLWLIGESCSQSLRHRVESLWGCPAYKYYGSLECGPIGVECQHQDGYHIATNFVCAEIDTELNQETKKDNAGEIIATVLWRYASPLIRYRTNDIGYTVNEPCKCGVPGLRLHVHGRKEDMLQINQKTFHISAIENVLLAIPYVDTWFRLMEENGSLRVMLKCSSKSNESDTSKAICEALHKNFDIQCVVEFVAEVDYAGGKFLRVLK